VIPNKGKRYTNLKTLDSCYLPCHSFCHLRLPLRRKVPAQAPGWSSKRCADFGCWIWEKFVEAKVQLAEIRDEFHLRSERKAEDQEQLRHCNWKLGENDGSRCRVGN